MFPLPFPPTPPRPSTPTTTPLPATAPALHTLYSSLLRPTLLPAPAAFSQPLLDSFVQHHDPLLDNQDIFTAAGRLREVGVEVEGAEREFRRCGVDVGVEGVGVGMGVVREGRVRCRLGNQKGVGNRVERERIVAAAKERLEAFEREMKREEEEALREFKEGLRRAVGGG